MMRSYIATLLVAFLAFSSGLFAYDVSKQKTPNGNLKVALDYSLATKWPEVNTDDPLKDEKDKKLPRSSLFSSHIVFKNDVSEISDGQLWQISRDGVDEMSKNAKQWGLRSSESPLAFGILAVGNEIFLASNQKKGPSFSYTIRDDDNPVKQALLRCQDSQTYPNWKTEKLHKNNGNCVEPVVAQFYYMINSKALKDHDPKPRGAVWTYKAKTKTWEKTPPCGDANSKIWGCNLLEGELGVDAISTEVENETYDLATLAGGVSEMNQVQLCGDVREYKSGDSN